MKKTVSIKKYSFSYQKSGLGPCLLLLHGFSADSGTWDSFKQSFESQFTLICPDMPGFGSSPVYEGFRVELMAEAIDAILQTESIESCYFVGHSMGGYVAMAFADLFTIKLKGLCLFHSQPFEDTDEKKKNRQKTIGFMERWGVAAFVQELTPKLFAPDFVSAHPDLLVNHIKKASQLPLTGMIAATEAMIHRPDRSAVLTKLDCPVLFIVGALDEAIPKEASMAQLHLPKHSTAIILEKVAHMGILEAEEETVAALRAWLD